MDDNAWPAYTFRVNKIHIQEQTYALEPCFTLCFYVLWVIHSTYAHCMVDSIGVRSTYLKYKDSSLCNEQSCTYFYRKFVSYINYMYVCLLFKIKMVFEINDSIDSLLRHLFGL